jgi:hypothetical protein
MRPAGGGAVLGFGARGRRRRLVGPVWWAGLVGRPRPSGKGRENRPVKKKRMGRGWAERPDGPKAEENYI